MAESTIEINSSESDIEHSSESDIEHISDDSGESDVEDISTDVLFRHISAKSIAGKRAMAGEGDNAMQHTNNMSTISEAGKRAMAKEGNNATKHAKTTHNISAISEAGKRVMARGLNNVAQQNTILRPEGEISQRIRLSVKESTSERQTDLSFKVKVNNHTTTAPVYSTGKCLSNGDQRDSTSSGHIKGTIIPSCDSRFDSEKHLKQHMTVSVKCDGLLGMPRNASNNRKPQQKASYYAAKSSSAPNVGHPETSSKLNKELHTLPDTPGSFSRNQDTGTPFRDDKKDDISETRKNELTSSASTETKDNLLDYSKPSKKIKRSRSMMSDYKHNSNNVGSTTKHTETGRKELTFPVSTEAPDNFQDYSTSERIIRSSSRMSEIVDTVQNVPASTETQNWLHGVKTRPCIASTPDITVEQSYSNAEKNLLPSKRPKNTDMSQYGDKQFRSVRNKKKHPARNVKRQSLVKPLPTFSCLKCDLSFASYEKKQDHLFSSVSCHLFLKNSFLDGKFLNDTPICDNYNLNKNMCPFCLFTVDNGDVISHVLSAMKCGNKLEEAISRYRTPSSNLPTPQHEPMQTAQFTSHCEPEKVVQFTCNFCERNYKTIRRLKAHITLTHSNHSKSSHQHKKERQHCNRSEHLFCFFCKKFLTSQTDINSHQCRSTRLLSRYWYRKAVWAESEYQCTACSDKFFHWKGALEKHMYNHDKKRSHLFKFLPCSSNQTEMLQDPCLDITNDTSSDTCHDDKHETTVETASEESSVEVSLDSLEYKKTGANNISAVTNNNSAVSNNISAVTNNNSAVSNNISAVSNNISAVSNKKTVSSNCSSKQTEMLHEPCLDITNDTSPDTCHDDKHETTIETASDESSEEVSLDGLEYKKPGANNISAVSNRNTVSEPCVLNKPSKCFACECCSTKFCLPDVFTAHVMTNSNCLLYYENQENKPPVTVCFCFKCKSNFKSDDESMSHRCIGVVSIIYKCALCLKMSDNLNSLRKHENKKHRVSMESENVETFEPCDSSEEFDDDTLVY